MKDNQFTAHFIETIRDADPDTVEQMLESLSIEDIELAGWLTEWPAAWNDLIRPALKRVRRSQSMTDYKASRKVLFAVIRCIGRWLRETGRSLHDTDLGDLFVQKVGQNDVELVNALLEAGADPNTEQTGTDFLTSLKSAVFNNRPELVRLLLHYGADAAVLQGDAPSVFHALTGMGRMEIAWVSLFFEVLGHAPERLVNAFKMGAPDGSMEAAIAQVELDEQEARRLFKALLDTSQGRAAAAVIHGYCLGRDITPEHEEATGIMLGFITSDHAIPKVTTLGNLIHPLRIAGFRVEELSCCKQDQALCKAIRNGASELTLDLMLRLGIRPLVRPDDDYLGNYTCEALSLAIESGMYDVILGILKANSLPYTCQFQAVEWLITENHTHHLRLIAGELCRNSRYGESMLELALEQERAACLAILIGCGANVTRMHSRLLHREQGVAQSLLARAIPVPSLDLPTNEEDSGDAASDLYHCVCIILLALEESWEDLAEFCDKIITARARDNDLEAVFFLCCLGYVPISLLRTCVTELCDPETEPDRLAAIGDMLASACEGLIEFLATVRNWNVQKFTCEALDCLIPGFAVAGKVISLEALLKVLDKNEALNDEVFAEPARLILAIKAIDEEMNLDIPGIARLVDAIDLTLAHCAAIPSLLETAREAVLTTLLPETFQKVQGILTTIHPEFIWEELMDRMDGYNLSIQQLIIMEGLSNTPDLAPLIFRDDPFFVEFSDSETGSDSSD